MLTGEAAGIGFDGGVVDTILPGLDSVENADVDERVAAVKCGVSAARVIIAARGTRLGLEIDCGIGVKG